MRHGKKVNHLSRKKGHRRALLANLSNALVTHKRITTTLAKAKALRRYVEPLITKARHDSTHSRRVVFGYLQNKESIKELFGPISAAIGARQGGYTRVIRLGFRHSDGAEMAMIELNVLNVYRLTRIFLADMQSRDAGTIINISSNSSFQPVPRMTTYASTKAFITHFSRGLQEEMKLMKSKVRIMCVCPAAITDTAFKKSANMESVKTFSGLAFTTAEEVAADVWRGYQRNKSFVVSGAKMRILYAIRGLVPYGLQQYLVRKETEQE